MVFRKDARALTLFLQTSDSGRNKEDATYLCRNEFEVEEMLANLFFFLSCLLLRQSWVMELWMDY